MAYTVSVLMVDVSVMRIGERPKDKVRKAPALFRSAQAEAQESFADTDPYQTDQIVVIHWH